MPPPYVSSDEIDGLMRVLPLYIYFPEEEWLNIKKAEKDNELGNELLANYSSIYSRDFLKDSQFFELKFLNNF